MPRKARPKSKDRAATQMKAWRKAKGLTLEKLSERLLVERELELSPGQMSRIERGEQPYTQDLLEALAHIYRTDPGSIIMRDPRREANWSIWDQASPAERNQAAAFIEVLRTKTGTDG